MGLFDDSQMAFAALHKEIPLGVCDETLLIWIGGSQENGGRAWRVWTAGSRARKMRKMLLSGGRRGGGMAFFEGMR